MRRVPWDTNTLARLRNMCAPTNASSHSQGSHGHSKGRSLVSKSIHTPRDSIFVVASWRKNGKKGAGRGFGESRWEGSLLSFFVFHCFYVFFLVAFAAFFSCCWNDTCPIRAAFDSALLRCSVAGGETCSIGVVVAPRPSQSLRRCGR